MKNLIPDDLLNEGFLRPKHVAQLFDVSVSTLYKRVEDGRISKPLKDGKISKWPVSEIREILRNHKRELLTQRDDSSAC